MEWADGFVRGAGNPCFVFPDEAVERQLRAGMRSSTFLSALRIFYTSLLLKFKDRSGFFFGLEL